MDALDIRHMHTHYRLPADPAGDLRGRLAEIQAGLLDGALEAALEQAGIRPDEEVCLRRLWVPVRLRGLAAGTRGTIDLVADWAAAITATLGDALAQGGDSVVRYRTRMQAWTDCAGGVARGDLSRAWAWRRLGLWRGGADLSPQGAAAELVRGLVFAPQAVVPVLIGLADQGALTPLARRLDPPSWSLLAAAALDAHGASRDLLDDTGAVPSPEAQVGEARPSARTQREVQGVVRNPEGPAAGSPLWPLGQIAGTENARPIAVLMLLAADPALGLRPLSEIQRQTERLVAGLLGQRSDPGRSPEPHRTQPSVRTAGSPDAEAPDRNPSGTGHRQPTGSLGEDADGEGGPVEGDPAPVAERAKTTAGPPEIRYGRDPGQRITRATRSSAEIPERESPTTEPAFSPAARTAATAWGGLLLLLNLLEPAGLLDPDAPVPPGRPLRWTLHRLAQTLAPVAADDPAALAFAGLGPSARPPSLDGPEASAAEKGQIAVLRGQVVACLQGVLDAGGEHPEALLARVCRRPAEILADPGWIEVRFPLGTLSTEVRRAGLDLDPDWLPWLGVVLRFRYE